MSSTSILIIVVVIIIAFIYCVCIKNNYEQKIESIIKSKRELEKIIEKSQEEGAHLYAAAAGRQVLTGVEFLENFAKEHQIQLEETEDSDEHYQSFIFSYQGKYFRVWAARTADVLLLRTGDIAQIPYDEKIYWNVMQLCYRYTYEKLFIKMNLRTETLESSEQIIVLNASSDLIGLSQQGLEYLLNTCFYFTNDFLRLLEETLNNKDAEINISDKTNADTEVRFQDVAMQMLQNEIEKQKSEDKPVDEQDSWSYK